MPALFRRSLDLFSQLPGSGDLSKESGFQLLALLCGAVDDGANLGVAGTVEPTIIVFTRGR